MVKELTTGEAAKIAGVAQTTALYWIKTGKLKGMVRGQKAGLFRTDHKINEAAFLTWLNEVNTN